MSGSGGQPGTRVPSGPRARRRRRMVVLHNPRSQSHVLPLALVHPSLLPEQCLASGLAWKDRDRLLEDWEDAGSDASVGPWIERPVRTWVLRYNFYLRHGYQPANGGRTGRLLHWAAKARVKTNFYRIDLEHRAASLLARARGTVLRQWTGAAE